MNGTPTPWRIEQDFESASINIIARQGPINVCPAVAHGMAEAQQIVRAVNAHDELVKALQLSLADWVEHLEELGYDEGDIATLKRSDETLAAIVAALAKAESSE